MTRGGLTTAIKTLLARRSNKTSSKTAVGRCMSKVARWDEYCNDDEVEVESFKQEVQRQNKECEVREESCWIPHPRTGIYYPKGHEWVMKDVPDGAASFTYNYWFRNSDSHGV